jgi:uncharacterized protein involved in exopolysaccharide biosynthesis
MPSLIEGGAPMSSNLESAHIGPTPVALAPVDVGPGHVLQAVFGCLWRCRLLVATIVLAALMIGAIAVLVMPTRYTAEASVRGVIAGLTADNSSSGSTGAINLDPLRVIETQTRQLDSSQLASRVVAQIGLERLGGAVSGSPSLLSEIFGIFRNSSSATESPADLAAKSLLRNLTVTSDPRAYLITVRYTDKDPDLAVLLANAFVAEFLRSSKLQALSQERSTAQGTLSAQLTRYGEKHPKVAEAKLRLASIDQLVRDQLAAAPEAVLNAAGESVTAARAAPSGPRPALVIALSFVLGLLISVAVALWLEGGKWWGAFSRYYAKPFA